MASPRTVVPLSFVLAFGCSSSDRPEAGLDAGVGMSDSATADGGLCESPVIYDQDLCLAAPDVGFCILADRVADAQSLASGLRCGTAFPACGDEAVPCRWGEPSGVCDGMSVEGYNRVICSLWDAGIVTLVDPIPLD